jgi:hypothetical protein
VNGLAVPHRLDRLRRDRRGLPVPYVNAWGAEDPARVRIAYDRHVRGIAVFHDEDPDGQPDFTRQDMGRQRECIIGGLCQVCARPVAWANRYLVFAALSIAVIDFGGREMPVITEPWLCRDCCAYAVQVCPALIRRRRDEEMAVVRVTSPSQVRIIVSKGWVEGPAEAESRRLLPVMWAKILLDGAEVGGA